MDTDQYLTKHLRGRMLCHTQNTTKSNLEIPFKSDDFFVTQFEINLPKFFITDRNLVYVRHRSGQVGLRSATILNDTLVLPLRRESKHKNSWLNPKFKMATLATTSHQKKIYVKISLFSFSQQFKSLFSGSFSVHLTFFGLKN